MHIKDIAITSLRRSGDGKRVLGDVTFQIGADPEKPSQILTLACDTAFSKKIRADAILIGDAIRQLRQTPAMRDGSEHLTFEKGMRPLSSAAPTMDRLSATG